MKHTPGKWHIGREQDHSADRFKRNIGAAAWLKSSGQPMVAQGLKKWVAEHGQPTLDRAEGVQNDEG